MASEAVVGAMMLTAAKRMKSCRRFRFGSMLRVTIEPQKISTSRAPARANRTAGIGSRPLTRAPARFAA